MTSKREAAETAVLKGRLSRFSLRQRKESRYHFCHTLEHRIRVRANEGGLMRAFRRLSPRPTFYVSFMTALAVFSVTQAAQQDKSSKTQIKNFGCVNEKYYRGAQPKQQDYADLAAIGVKTVIDLQRDGQNDERAMVEAQGMKFYRIGM